MGKCALCGVEYDPEEGPECGCAERLERWVAAEMYKDAFREEVEGNKPYPLPGAVDCGEEW